MDKPIIELFRTPNSYYLFDVNKNEIIPIDYDSYHYLRELFDLNNQQHSEPAQVRQLKEQGYLSTVSAVKDVRHIYTDHLQVFLERKLSKITLQLTQNCNFRCKYCIYSEEHSSRQRTHTAVRMTWKTAKKAVDFLREHSVDSPSVNIGFYGGEPLMEFELLKKIVRYSLDHFEGKKITYSITSNGTLLDDEMILFFQEHEISLMISLDGPKEINDRNRVFADGSGTFDKVAERINRIREIAPDYASKLQISMVMDPDNDFDCINEISLDDSQFSKLSLQPSLVEREYGDENVKFSEEYSWKYEYQRFLSILAYFKRFPQEEVSPITERSLASAITDYPQIENGTPLQMIEAPSGPCIPGQLRLFVNVYEQLFPCERVSEKSPPMCIGTLDDGFNLENAKKILNVGQLTGKACQSCWCFRHCMLCAKKADDGSEQLSAKKKLNYCEEARTSAYFKLYQHLLLKEIPLYYCEQMRSHSGEGGMYI